MIMKKLLLLGIAIVGIALLYRAAKPDVSVVLHSTLPTEASAKLSVRPNAKQSHSLPIG